MESYYARGDHTLKVPMSLFRENRERLLARLKRNNDLPAANTFVILQGGIEIPFNDTDTNWPFRQVCIPPPSFIYISIGLNGQCDEIELFLEMIFFSIYIMKLYYVF